MHQMDQKKLLIERILPYLTGAPADAVQRLLQQSVTDLEEILDDAITKKARAQATERVNQHAAEMRRESRLEGAWTHACCALINGKRLALVAVTTLTNRHRTQQPNLRHRQMHGNKSASCI
jgi:hypothetical protein